MKFSKHIGIVCSFFLLIVVMLSCTKVDITFGDNTSATDPNITYFDNYAVNIATYKPDSIAAPPHKIFAIGNIYDTAMGIVNAGSYAQINMPSVNPLLTLAQPNLTPIYDSIELIFKPVGGPTNFYGDSTRNMLINVYQLNQNIVPSTAGGSYYNTSAFSYNPTPIGTKLLNFYATTDSMVHIKLSDALGNDLFTKFLSNDYHVSTQAQFVNYFNGIYITTDNSVTNSLAYFQPGSDSLLIKLSYHQIGLYPIVGTINFNYDATNQFNSILGNFITPCSSPFINKQQQIIPSTATCNKSYLNSNLGTQIEISFPNLIQLKELHPYVRVVQALLVIKPDASSYNFPYILPKTLNLYTTDITHSTLGSINTTSGSGLQNGNLIVDNLYNLTTNYTFDITNFINLQILQGGTQGQGIQSALQLRTTLTNFDNSLQRLIINDQNTSSNKQIQLKLYVLGI